MSDFLPGLRLHEGQRQYGGPHGYGHIWDGTTRKTPFVHLAQRLGFRDATSAASLMSMVLDSLGPGILDQVNTSSCVGHAHCGASMTRFVALGNPVPYRLSPVCFYDLARLVDRVPNSYGVFPPLQDQGSMPSSCIRGAAEWGVCSYSARPTDASSINDEPKLLELEQGEQVVIRGAYEIFATGQSRHDQVQLALANLFPVTIATIVDPAFEAWRGGNPIQPPDLSQGLGGHDIYLVGYETMSDGSVVYNIANSWGTGWGEQGFGRVSAAWVDAAMDLIVMDVNHIGVDS